MAATTPDGAHIRPPEARIADEVRGGVDDLVRLGRMEIELAKLEAGAAGKRIGIGAGMAVVALLLLYAGFVVALVVPPALLGHWWLWPADALALFVIAAVIALRARRKIMRAVKEVKGTYESIKGDLEWLRQLATRRNNDS
jgi:putative superfamily III holin-X